jgi:ABC-type antimicrobial peptide transport system permease subunit
MPGGSKVDEITPADVRVWIAAIAIVLIAAAIGTLIPAVKASRVDPLQALRQE